MYQQVARCLLRASGWHSSVGKAATSRVPLTSPWLRPGYRVNRAICSNSRGLDAVNNSSELSKLAPQDLMRQALELGVQLPELCSGCGVNLQAGNPDVPGFFQISQRYMKQLQAQQSKQDEQVQDPATAERLTPVEQGEVTDRLERQQNLETSTSDSEDAEQPSILCARCYSLRHYGHIISQQSERALPSFDLTKKVGKKIKLQKYRRAVVLCVVDLADFDGSLPKAALQELLPGLEQGQSQAAQGYRLIIAASKVDLLPSQATAARLQAWIYRRCRQANLPPPAAVHLISSVKGTGVKNLLTSIQEMVGMRGDVWVVGAQNAGKSSLINAMQKLAGMRGGGQQLTTAAHPGTTLGMLKVGGLLQSGCRMWDTPGVPHPYQLSSKLSAEEVRMLLPRRKLKPRTFRASVGQTILVGGLARMDLMHLPAQTMYLTIWASDEVSCHYGRTDNADERLQSSSGSLLVPPLGGEARVAELGPLLPHNILLEGNSWKESSVDIAIAGLGWIAVGVKGRADLRVWVHKGVGLTTHASIVPDYAQSFERPGFSNSNLKIVDKATIKSSKIDQKSKVVNQP